MSESRQRTHEQDVTSIVGEVFAGWDLSETETITINRAVRKIAAANGDITDSGLRRAANAIRASIRLSQLPDRKAGT